MDHARRIQIGSGSIEGVFDMLSSNKVAGKLLYVTDPVVDGIFGDVVRPQLAEIGRIVEEIIDKNTIAYAMSLAERIIATDVDCVIGMGGGKVLDVCKYAAYISKKPLLSIPTTMANDGIASPIAVLKKLDGKPKSLGCAIPTMIILDTEVIINGPTQLIKAGIGDTISNYMALLDWKLACLRGRDEMNGYAYLMSKTSLDVLMKTQYSVICPEFIDVLANSLILSGIAMDFAGSSRPVSGSEHLFSHALDMYSEKPNLHGLQVALGTVATLMLIDKDYSDVLKYLTKFDVKINPRLLQIEEETFVFCMQRAVNIRNDRYTYLHETDLSTDRLKRVYKKLLEEL